MFTGIVQVIGEVKCAKLESGALQLTVAAPSLAEKLEIGGSVSINGACLTAVKVTARTFTVEAIEETLSITNFGSLELGDQVNLERPLSVDGHLDGHIVNGHVDGTATISNIEHSEHSKVINFLCSPILTELIVPKGCVAINGVSLTVLECGDDFFSVALIPHTLEVTNLGCCVNGDVVNVELDIVAKYVQKIHSGQKAKRAAV